MSIIREIELEEFANGYYAVQPFYCDIGFAELIGGALPPECHEPYLKVYRQFRHKESGTIVCENSGPWVIVVFGSDPKMIRRRTLGEIVPLAKALYPSIEMRARFIERAYTAVKIPMEDSDGFGGGKRDA